MSLIAVIRFVRSPNLLLFMGHNLPANGTYL